MTDFLPKSKKVIDTDDYKAERNYIAHVRNWGMKPIKEGFKATYDSEPLAQRWEAWEERERENEIARELHRNMETVNDRRRPGARRRRRGEV